MNEYKTKLMIIIATIINILSWIGLIFFFKIDIELFLAIILSHLAVMLVCLSIIKYFYEKEIKEGTEEKRLEIIIEKEVKDGED